MIVITTMFLLCCLASSRWFSGYAIDLYTIGIDLRGTAIRYLGGGGGGRGYSCPFFYLTRDMGIFSLLLHFRIGCKYFRHALWPFYLFHQFFSTKIFFPPPPKKIIQLPQYSNGAPKAPLNQSIHPPGHPDSPTPDDWVTKGHMVPWHIQSGHSSQPLMIYLV